MAKSGYVMYGAEFSLYSGKLRSYLYKKGIDFKEVKPWAWTYKKFIVPRTGVSYIPVLQTPEDEVWQDTSIIIDELEKRFPSSPMVPATPRRKLAALLLELFGDEWLLNVAMHYRWNVPQNELDELYVEFGKMVVPVGPRFLHHRLGKKLGARFKNIVPRLGVTPETIPALEEWYENFLSLLDAHFANTPFLMGSNPTIADFGFIGPFYAHLYRDPRPSKHLRSRAPNVARWVERMVSQESTGGSDDDGDKIPDTLLPILKQVAVEQLPVLRETAQAFDSWAESQEAGTKVPRHLGMHSVKMAGVTCSRSVLPYSLWMLQRAIDHWLSLSASEREELTGFVSDIGIDFESWQQDSQLIRVDNRLRLG